MTGFPKVQTQNHILQTRAFSVDLETLWRLTRILHKEVPWSKGIRSICAKTSSSSLPAPSSEIGLHYFDVFVKFKLKVLFRWNPATNSEKLKIHSTVQVPPQISVQLPRIFRICLYWFLTLQKMQATFNFCSPMLEKSAIPEVHG